MDLGQCWDPGVWADGSWVDGAWCPESPCVPASIGECWAVAWCEGTWQNNAWCPSSPVPPAPVVVVEARRWPGPSITIYRETDIIPAWQRKREDEEIMIL